MNQKKVRILMAKLGEGYEPAIMKLGVAFSEAGFEVIYTTIQDPKAIVTAAIQESADHIGITTLPGAQIEDFAKLYVASPSETTLSQGQGASAGCILNPIYPFHSLPGYTLLNDKA